MTAQSRAAWQGLFRWLADTSGVPLVTVDHPPPAPLSQLWSRPDLGCVVMCGWPFFEACPRPRLIASIVPTPTRFGGQARYWSDLVVRADTDITRLEQAFGGTVGWTIEDSHSGYNMLRHHLLAYRDVDRPTLFSRSVGGLINPLGALTALVEGQADIVPVDSFCHDLLRAEDHVVTRRTRTIGRTASSPMPVLVASAQAPDSAVARMQDALLQAHGDPQCRPHLADALIDHFVVPDIADFACARRIADEAIAAGYRQPS